MKNRVLIIPLIIFFILISLFFIIMYSNYSQKEGEENELTYVGVPLSEVNIEPFYYKDNPVFYFPEKNKYLLNVWATWCLPCKAEHKFLNKLRADGVTIVGINYNDNKEKATDWLVNYQNPYLLNFIVESNIIDIGVIINSVPETFIIDQSGIILYRYKGMIDNEIWINKLKPIFDSL
ncbi:DsbE family thiol:disulfide interchange protein [Morganella morganii]|nr:DsbE family thiol:disulfide interchange protein [Morganella morganii]